MTSQSFNRRGASSRPCRRCLTVLSLAVLVSLASFPSAGAREPVIAPQPGENPVAPQITWHTTDRWPNLSPISFRLNELPGQSFLLIFPEWLTSRQQSWHVRPTWKREGSCATAEWTTEEVRLQLTLKFSRRRNIRELAWACSVRNLTEAALDDVSIFNCFNLVDAPLFQDLTMERTWVGDGAEHRVSLAEVARVQAPRTIQFYPARGGLTLPKFERFSRYRANSPQELRGDRIGVVSRDGKWAVESVVAGQVAYFFNNWEADHGCVHAAPLLGKIAVGKQATATGRLVFRQLPAE